MWISPLVSPEFRQARDERRRLAIRLGIDKGTIIRRNFINASLNILALRPGTPEDVLADVVSDLAAAAYFEKGIRKEPLQPKSFYPPSGQALPYLVVRVYSPGERFPGTRTVVPPGHTGLAFGL